MKNKHPREDPFRFGTLCLFKLLEYAVAEDPGLTRH
jgi:hypothetical protein